MCFVKYPGYQSQKGGRMERTGWQRTSVRIITTVMTIAVMAMIYCFSAEDAEQSDRTSGRFSDAAIRMIYPEYDRMTPERRQAIYNTVQHAVRKSAHFSEYLLLGVMIRMCLKSWFGGRKWLLTAAWAIGTGYAVTDEFHQILTDGRNGGWTDVLIDSGGIMTGVLIAWLIVCMTQRMRKKA